LFFIKNTICVTSAIYYFFTIKYNIFAEKSTQEKEEKNIDKYAQKRAGKQALG